MPNLKKKIKRFLEGNVSPRKFMPGKEPKQSTIGTTSGRVPTPRSISEKGVLTTRDINRATGNAGLKSTLSADLGGNGKRGKRRKQ